MWHSARVCQYNMTSSTTNSMIIEHRPNIKNKIIHETNWNQPVVEEISANANFPFLPSPIAFFVLQKGIVGGLE